MKLTISILEDQPAEAEHLKSILNKWSLQANCELTISEYSSGEDFFKENDIASYQTFSLFLLDIQMKKMSGLDVAKKLRKEGYQGSIIFLTAFREYVFHGYEVHAMNYLIKPVKEDTLFLCLDEIAKDLSASAYLYRNKQDIISIPYKEILSFSSSLHYIDILTVSDHFCQYATLNNIIEYLPQEFIRTHKSCIVNMAHIYKISGTTIVLSNHMTTQIGRSYSKSVVASFAAYSTRFDSRGYYPMISMISKKIVQYLIAASTIETESDQAEVYIYGLECFLNTGITILILCIWGVLTNTLMETFCWIAAFSILRHHSGGLHAPTQFTCILCVGFFVAFMFRNSISISILYADICVCILILFRVVFRKATF